MGASIGLVGCAMTTETAEEKPELKFLGQDEMIAAHSKPLPARQYDIQKVPRPNLPSSVIFSKPETPYLDIQPKNPEENERILAWLREWDSIQKQQRLAEAYRVSYVRTSKKEYLVKSLESQNQVVNRYVELQKTSWPNSDYAYRAFRAKMVACQQLSLLEAFKYYEGLQEAELDEEGQPIKKAVCSMHPY